MKAKWSMKSFLLVTLMIISLAGFSQTATQTNTDSVYTYATVAAEYKGDWDDFLAKNLKYPDSAYNARYRERVYASFIVEKDGSIGNIRIRKGKAIFGLESEIKRLLELSAPWEPAKENQMPVRFMAVRSFNFDIPVEEIDIFTIVDTAPEFPGGQEALDEYYAKNMVYPESLKKENKHGAVYVTFVVEKDGSITFPRIIGRSLSPDADREALRLIKMMPRWSPGKMRGEALRVQFATPVKF